MPEVSHVSDEDMTKRSNMEFFIPIDLTAKGPN